MSTEELDLLIGQHDYKLFLNVFGLAVFAVLFSLTRTRGATDPACGMRVDRHRALRLDHDGGTLYFCSEHCRRSYGAEDAGTEAEKVLT